MSADGASRVVLEPWLQAVGVEDVTTRQESALLLHLEVGDAYCAAGWLESSIVLLLAMLILDFNFGEGLNDSLRSWSMLAFFSLPLHVCPNQVSEVSERREGREAWIHSEKTNVAWEPR